MNIQIPAKPVTLAKGAMSVYTDATDAQIRCDRGALWLTQDGDTRDIVLKAGEQFQPDRRGNVLVYALEASSLTVAPATRPQAEGSSTPFGVWLSAHFARRVAAFGAGRRYAFE